MAADPIALQLVDLVLGIVKASPTFRGATYDEPFDFACEAQPWVWIYDFDTSYEPQVTPQLFNTAKILTIASFRFDETGTGSLRRGGHRMIAELKRALRELIDGYQPLGLFSMLPTASVVQELVDEEQRLGGASVLWEMRYYENLNDPYDQTVG